jgi:hypothetical protein
MHPVVLRGRSGLQLPAEEFGDRVARIRADLARRRLDALVAFGDARDYAPLAWVTGLVPMLRWAVAIVPVQGEIALYTAMAGARDLPAVQRLAAVDSVATISALPGALAAFDRVAVAGIRSMRAAAETMIRAATTVADDGDRLLGDLMVPPSPAERALLRVADRTAERAAGAIASELAAGASGFSALLAGDLCAREAGVNDVRLLWSLDGGATLRPPQKLGDGAAEPSVYYLAVQSGGYWGEALYSAGDTARCLPSGLSPVARLGLSVQENAPQPLSPGFYSRRQLDDGRLCARAVEVE